MAAGEEARVVIGVDFGTTFSGFAYGHRDEPEKVFTFYEWPGQVGKSYCKTPTSIFYFNNGTADAPEYEATLWGWPAPLHHMKEKEMNLSHGALVSQFKLLLAPGPGKLGRLLSRSRGSGSWRGGRNEETETADILPGVTAVRAITDYLGSICRFALAHVQATYGEANATAQQVQWCLTVPAIWDDAAKQVMRNCAQRAGIVTGPLCPARELGTASPHPLLIVLESEAASVYCAKKRQLRLVRGDEFLVADVGGGTVDIVVHTKENQEGENLLLREVRQSSGDMCGGAFVDRNFLKFVSGKIPCFDDVVSASPSVKTVMLRRWEEIKAVYGADEDLEAQDFEIPAKLRREMKRRNSGADYDELEISPEDMAEIFDPVIEQCIGLIRQQLTSRTRVLLVVGGFSASPYLRNKVKAAFQEELGGGIVMPPDPGSAVCQGAVLFGFFPRTVVSRVSRKTYGIQELLPFEPGDPEEAAVSTAGGKRCSIRFSAFARKGEPIGIHQCVTHSLYPQFNGQRSMAVRVFSSSASEVRYTTDPGVEMEGEFIIDMADDAEGLGLARHVRVSMYFGMSCIEVKARRINFGNRFEVMPLHDTIGFEHS